jgi:hypothetical protein
MVELTLYISHAVAIVILGINIAICISKHHKLKNEVKELAEINCFLLNRIDRLEREIRLSHDALLRAKEQLLKQQQYGQRQD